MSISQPPATHSKLFPTQIQPTNLQTPPALSHPFTTKSQSKQSQSFPTNDSIIDRPPTLSQTTPALLFTAKSQSKQSQSFPTNDSIINHPLTLSQTTPALLFTAKSQSKQSQSFSTNDSIIDHSDSCHYTNDHNPFHNNSVTLIDFNQLQSPNIQSNSNSFQITSSSCSLPVQLCSIPQTSPPLLHSQPILHTNSLPLSMHSQPAEVPSYSLVCSTQPTDYVCSDKEISENTIPNRILTAPTGKKLVKQLLGYFFDRDKLIKASLSGKKGSSKFSVLKKVGLDPAVLHLITELTICKFPDFSKSDVNIAISQKINNEHRACFKAAPKTQTEKNA